jgi:hypothetical protein
MLLNKVSKECTKRCGTSASERYPIGARACYAQGGHQLTQSNLTYAIFVCLALARERYEWQLSFYFISDRVARRSNIGNGSQGVATGNKEQYVKSCIHI